MTERGINRLSPDSIQDIDDVKKWARDYETRTEHKLGQMSGAICELKKRSKRQERLLLATSVGFGAILAVVVLLNGIFQIIKALF